MVISLVSLIKKILLDIDLADSIKVAAFYQQTLKNLVGGRLIYSPSVVVDMAGWEYSHISLNRE